MKIVVVCGPTGIGKTSTAIKLAQVFDGEIISADSMQIYRHMDIGTAKPDKEEQKQVVHYLLDVADPDEPFDAALFADLSDKAVQKITGKKKLPIVAGGTGFYIKALLYGLFRASPADQRLIQQLEQEAQKKGGDTLYKKLERIDPVSAASIHPHDTFRIVRALEVFMSTGRTMSSFQKSHEFAVKRYDALKIGLVMDRQELYRRIEQRVDLMMDQGLIDEVENLRQMGYSCDLKSMQSIGYRHICDFLNKKVSFEETLRLLKRDTRRYAKRQLTWFGREKDIVWIDPGDTDRAEFLVKDFLDRK
ncbi:MAG: tRNA (adenosine(37)-N6)-dimethylallyltransferase MiaA [Thermodesulfobacteriota bacterium]|nr:tRNA (adenosine(37)-N6)-dimethylallyltransferase MiaA [Thermodesulfobacteriota bacterium]